MEYDVIIVPTFAQVESWRKAAAAERRSGLFARSVVTFDSWIADLWELHGDGRTIIDAVLREVLMRNAAEAFEKERGCSLVDTVSLACRCVQQGVGVETFDRAVDSARSGIPIEGLSTRENEFLGLVAHYEDDARGRGFVELGEAASLLACKSDEVFPRKQNVLVAESGSLTWVQERFFSCCEALNVVVDSAGDARGVKCAPDGVDVRFAFPAGRLAQPGLIADIIVKSSGAGSYVITCKDPLFLAGRLETRLVERGFNVRVQASKPFAQTDFGRAFLACSRAMGESAWSPALLSDAVGSFFSGFSRSDAIQVDKALRADRIADREKVVSQLRDESESFSQLVSLATGAPAEADAIIGAFEGRVQSSSSRSGAWKAEQLAALKRVRRVIEASLLVGVGVEACADMLEGSSVSVTIQSKAEDAGNDSKATVFITTQGVAASLPSGWCDIALFADFTSEDYPVAEKDDAASTLFAAVGLSPVETALERARREFNSLTRLPSHCIVFCRPLGDDNADETYPAAMLEEFIDTYRSDPSDMSEVDNDYRLPAALQVGLVERGEELLFANSDAVDADAVQVASAEVAQPDRGDVAPQVRADVAPRRFDSKGQPIEGLCPSPSQIEAYLECPYQWFANRRLHIETLDEGFGLLEKGSFAHAALETFYRRFQEAGQLKVSESNLEEARALMRKVTSELAEQQYAKDPGSGRLVAANEFEKREVMALCDQLVNYLDCEAQLLPTFHPAYFEYEIDADHAVDYASYHLVGTVDRIDVDSNGRAVIVDYKGSVNDEHEIYGKVEGHCGKVQTRIYAQVIKRLLGLDVVGALYVSYGRNPKVSGAYDSCVVEAAHLPGVRIDRCSCGTLEEIPEELPEDFSLASLSFDAMLDETEAIVGRALNAMEQGDVVPRPAYSKVCTYCPVLACPQRGE